MSFDNILDLTAGVYYIFIIIWYALATACSCPRQGTPCVLRNHPNRSGDKPQKGQNYKPNDNKKRNTPSMTTLTTNGWMPTKHGRYTKEPRKSKNIDEIDKTNIIHHQLQPTLRTTDVNKTRQDAETSSKRFPGIKKEPNPSGK